MFGDFGIIFLVLTILILFNNRQTAIVGSVIGSPLMVNRCKQLGGKWFSPTGLGGCCDDCPRCTSDITKCSNRNCPYFCGWPFHESTRKLYCQRIKCWNPNPPSY